MRRRIVAGIVALALVGLIPLGAVSLDEVMAQAKKQSSTMQLLELNKQQNEIALGLGDVKATLSVKVSGDASYRDVVYGVSKESSILGSPTLTLVLPNDGGTQISVGLNSLSKSLTTTKWTVDPSVNVSHTISFGNIGDTLADLKLAKQQLEVQQSYTKGVYNFENSVYQKMQDLLGYEKSILSSQKDILVQKTKMENALALRTTTRESSTYKNMELSLARLENTLSATNQRYALAKSQFKQMTGIEWQGIDQLREAKLSFSVMPTGDTSVVIAALAVEIAKEDLAIKEQDGVMKLVVGGGASLNYGYDNTPIPNRTASYNLNANGKLTDSRFSLGATVNMGVSNAGAITPTVTVNGSWNNNPTSESDVLTLQKLGNAVTIATINYQESMTSYLDSAYQLQNDILNYKLDLEQFNQTAAYNELLLGQAVDKLAKGLGIQSEVDDARLTVQLNVYDRKVYQLKALVLENRAKALQL
jgi:hypothetical protein